MKALSKLAGIVAIIISIPASNVAAHDDAGEGKGALGKVSFVNTCEAKVQPQLQRGIAMLHSFWFNAGEATFRDVLAHDPGCAIAHWGIASLLMSNPLAGQGALPKDLSRALTAVDEARKVGTQSRTSQRERDYIEAVAAYYRDFDSKPERARQDARSKAYQALAARYPDDDEAQIFNALYLAGTQLQSDQTYAAYLKAAEILEKQFSKNPDHPGVAHYLIHSYDAQPIARQGIKAARFYVTIAPAAPHALHMPSHIFTRVGAWEDSVATNLRSFDTAVKGNDLTEAYHASDYAVYANLQIARDNDAKQVMNNAMKVTLPDAFFVGPYGAASMPARYALERSAWGEAAALPDPKPSRFPHVDAITFFARALGAARSGDLASAARNGEQLATMHKTLLDAKNNYWATEVEVQRLTIAAWIALAGKDQDNALKLMRAAADLEDRNEKHIVTPGRPLPARELLADMLMEVRQPALALREYEVSQEREPNRYRGLSGAASAANAAGDKTKAATYYSRLLTLAKNADAQRPELAIAKAYVASR